MPGRIAYGDSCCEAGNAGAEKAWGRLVPARSAAATSAPRWVLLLVWATLLGGPSAPLAAAEPQVNLEVATSRIGVIEGPQQWARALDGVGFASVRLRTAGPGDRPRVEKSGTDDAPVYHVTGLLSSNNELLLPDARIRYGDRKAVEIWLAKLVAPPDPANDRMFGMTPEQIKAVQEQLSVAMAGTTAGQSLEEVVRDVKSQLPLELEVSVGMNLRLREARPVADELQGLALGTVLAASLRTAGLGFAPVRDPDAGGWRLRVVEAEGPAAIWPVGWTPDAPPPVLVPKLFEKLEVEIIDTPLRIALASVQQRVGVPMVIDHYALDTRQIRLDDIKVRFPKRRVSYLRVLERLLYQGQLEVQVRVDEAHRPFLWIERLAVTRR